MTDHLRTVHRHLAIAGATRSRFARGQWSRGYLAEEIGPRILIHWFGADREAWLPRCELALVDAGFMVEHITNAAGEDALATTAPVLCAHCQAPVRGRSPADPQSLCRRERSVAWSGPECAVLVADWGHPTPCVDCGGQPNDELSWSGVDWLAKKCEIDPERMMEAVTW